MFIYTPEHVILAIFVACIVLFWPAIYLFAIVMIAVDWVRATWRRITGQAPQGPSQGQ